MNGRAVPSEGIGSLAQKRSFSGKTALLGCLLGSSLGVLGFVAALAAFPKTYQSRAVVQLKAERGPGEGDVKPEVSLPDRIRELFVADQTVGPVVDQFGLTQLWRVDTRGAAKRIRDEVRVEWAKGRDAYAVTYRNRDPLMSAAIVNALVDSCQEQMRAAHLKAGPEMVRTPLPMILVEKAEPGTAAWQYPWNVDLPRGILVWMAAGGILGLIVSTAVCCGRKVRGA